VAAALVAALTAPAAHAKTNASAAAGFVEEGQNKDGGFGTKHGRASNPAATLWASVALLAAGKNPRDEFLKNGKSADDYLVAHRSSYTSLGELGLLAVVQNTGRFGGALYGNPGTKLTQRLSRQAVRANPKGAALAIFGLIAVDTPSSRRAAGSASQALLGSLTSDGAWGPNGNADSASTALVLQALAATGAATGASPAAKSGLAYLRAAQINDGSIASSTRVDKATAGGSVAATAFTLQAIAALGVPTLRTPTGKTVRQGLTQYQQASSGGLTSRGSQYSPVPPSVVETAQAFPAFNGNTLPLARVASTTGGPDLVKRKNTKGSDPSSNRVSSGTAAQGVSGDGGSGGADPGAFKRATATGNGKAREKGQDGSAAGKVARAAAGAAGTDISGTVVGTGPRLAAKAGAGDDGLTNQQRATLLLGMSLVLLFVLGASLERVRPRPAGAPPLVVVGMTSAAAAIRPIARGGARLSGISAARAGEAQASGRRWPLLLVLAVAGVLIAIPFATHMFDRAPKGATMVSDFEPYMRAERLDGFQRDVRQVDEYAQELRGKAPALLGRETFTQRYPQTALFSQQWPDVNRTFTRLLGTIQANRTNYEAAAALPSFRLFPWFFVVPGALLALLALAALLAGGDARIPLRRATIALGIGLLLAPAVFQMFDRAPKGAEMVSAFKTIETRATVQKLQGDFGTIAVGQGAIKTDLVPALRATGMSDADIKRELPAAARLKDRWVEILNNITPMIGVMSDNVGNYQAVAALPSFSLFIWLFAVPGVLVIGLALLSGKRPRKYPPRTRSLMIRSPLQSLVVAAALGAVLSTASTAVAAPAKNLTGTFAFTPGKVKTVKKNGKRRKVTGGTYFRMIYPNGSVKKGPFFKNSDSKAKTYTLLKPGIDGGLRTGVFQQPPTPAFAPNGFALSNRIIPPTSFAGIKFSLSTAPTDAQSGKPVGVPTIKAKGRKLSGDLRAFTASWNSIWFNQGSPKPAGNRPGLTRPVRGTYNPKTKRFVITWVSQIVGGPFNDFSGYWHLQGRFKP
jgi:hypothetical protein